MQACQRAGWQRICSRVHDSTVRKVKRSLIDMPIGRHELFLPIFVCLVRWTGGVSAVASFIEGHDRLAGDSIGVYSAV